MPRPILPYAIFLSVALLVAGCGDRSLDLIDDETPRAGGPSDPGKPDTVRKVNNAPEVPVRPAEDRMDQFQVAGARILFRDLSIGPSFHWENAEYRLFQYLQRVLQAWDRICYRSLEEAEIAAFLAATLHAMHVDEDYKPLRFRELRAFALPVFLRKEVPARHRPAFEHAELEREALALWARGFNLNFTRTEDLQGFLTQLGEVLWRDHAFVPQDPTEALTAALRDETVPLERDDLQAARRCAQQVSRKPRTELSCDFGRYQLRFSPARENQPTLTLTVSLDTGRGRELIQEFLTSYQKRPGWLAPGVQVSQTPLVDDYVLAATGPEALTFGPLTVPGDPALPQNLRQTDWETFSPPLLEATETAEVRNLLGTCGTSLMESLALFERFSRRIEGRSQDGLSGSRLHPGHPDGEILSRTGSWIWFLHAASAGHHLALGIKSGCEEHVVRYLALRARWLMAAQGDHPGPEAASLILAFRLLLSLRGGQPKFPTPTTGGEPAAPEAPKAPIAAITDLGDPKDAPELHKRELLIPLLEAAWPLLSQPEGLLATATSPAFTGIQLFSPQRIKETRAALDKLDLRRTYLPALLRPTPERVSYRRAKDALDYYLQLSQEARRGTERPR